MATATFGRSAPVAIGVAIAFAVSWKPFVKSKKSASAMTSTTMRVRSTGVFLWIGVGIHRVFRDVGCGSGDRRAPRRYYATDSRSSTTVARSAPNTKERRTDAPASTPGSHRRASSHIWS